MAAIRPASSRQANDQPLCTRRQAQQQQQQHGGAQRPGQAGRAAALRRRGGFDHGGGGQRDQAVGHRLGGVGQPRTRAHQGVPLRRRKAAAMALPQRQQRRPTGPRRHLLQGGVSGHHQGRLGAQHELRVELRERAHRRRHHIAQPQARQQFADERSLAGRVRRGSDLEVHAAPAPARRHARGGLVDAALQAGHQRLRLARPAQRARNHVDGALRVGPIAWLQRQHVQAQRLQPVSAARRHRHQHQIGLERDDALDLRVFQPAELGQGPHATRASWKNGRCRPGDRRRPARTPFRSATAAATRCAAPAAPASGWRRGRRAASSAPMQPPPSRAAPPATSASCAGPHGRGS